MKKIVYASVIIGLLSFTIVKNTDFLATLEKKLNYYTNHAPEKIYIQTDKPFYATDDDLWFSAFLVNGVTHQQTDKSKVVHVELINSKDSIVAQKKLFFNNTIGSGDFKIKKNWEPGTYLLRAYTKYMQNHGNDSFFQKEISIHNFKVTDSVTAQPISTEAPTPTQKNTPENKKKVPKIAKPTLKFYPEGGNLIANTPNRVAFEVTAKDYGEVKLTGVIKDMDGNEVMDFKTIALGLGSFVFTPEKNKSYYASVSVNGKEEKYSLPTSLNEGYNLTVINTGQQVVITTTSTTKNGLEGSYLVAHQRGQLLYKQLEKTKTTQNSVYIGTQKLSDGIVTITLFDANANPVAERLIFVDNVKNNLTLNIKAPEQSIGIRKKVDLEVAVKNKEGEMVASNLSLTVRNLNAFPYNTRSGNIKSWLLLNSDLKGKVSNAGYFFEKEEDPKRKYLLDLLLMTHGWRRFTWQSILENQSKDTYIEPEQGLYISGITKQLKKPYQPFAAPTRLTFFGKTILQEPIQKSDTLGKFKFGPYVFFDTIPVLIESRLEDFSSKKRESRNVIILVDKDKNQPEIDRSILFDKRTENEKKLQIEKFVKVTQYIKEVAFKYSQEVEKLNEITLIAKRKSELEERQEEMNDIAGYGEPIEGQRLDLLNDFEEAASYTAFDVVSLMKGVITDGDSIYLSRSNRPARILMDNLEIDASFLKTIGGDEISFIDILTGIDALTFTNASNGVIALFSNSGSLGNRNITRKPGIINFQAEGFYTARQFYSPNPDNDFEWLNKPDLRSTLYWQPILQTNTNTPTKVSFYGGDLRSDYIVEVQGITKDGTPIHGFTTFLIE